MTLASLFRYPGYLAVVLCGVTFLSWPGPVLAVPSLTRGPYPQMPTADGITIVWRSRAIMLPQLVVQNLKGEHVTTVNSEKIIMRRTSAEGVSSTSVKPLYAAPEGTLQFEASVNGLTPNTAYLYSILDAGQQVTPRDGSCRFETLPLPGKSQPFKFWVVGDSGTASESQKAVYHAFLAWEKKNKPVNFYMHVGDMAYTKGSDSEFQYSFFDIYGDRLRGLSCWPAMGNHEGGTAKGTTATGPYFDAYVCPAEGQCGGLPSGTESYYSWDYGTTHFICLNSHDMPRSATGAMAQWLKADLEKTKAEWVIAYWHHPPYTKGSHDSDKEKDLVEIREQILPICETGGVDVVFTGHSHVYERSMLLDGAYSTPTVATNGVLDDRSGDPGKREPYHKMPGITPNGGTIQVVTGHGGQALSRKPHPSPVMNCTITEWGSLIVSVDGNTLTGIMINTEGETRDTFAIIKDAKATPARIASPRPPGKPQGPERLKSYGKSKVVMPDAADP